MSNSPNPNNPNNHNLNKSPNNLPNNKFTNMLFSQVQTTLPPQFTEYPQQAFVQQTYQQQQQQQHLQAQQAFQQHQQLQLLMQQSGQHQHQYQPQPQQQQQQQQPFPSTQLPVLQQQQVYAQPVNQSENYYIQAPRGYGYSSSLSSNTSNASVQQYPLNELRQANVHSITPEKQSINFNSENYNYLVLSLPPLNTIGGSTGSHTPQQQHQQQPQVYNTSPLSATYVHENAQYVVPSVDTVRGFPARGGIVPKRGRKRRHTATVHNMTPETAERNRCRICNKQFKRPSSLQTHYYSHTGEKIFKCPWDGCGRLFSVKSNMTRHYRLHERDFKRAQDLQFGPSQPQQPPQPPQQQVTGIAASHAPTTALQQQEPFNTNNQNLGSSDSAAKSQYPSYLSSSNLPTTDNNPSI